MSPPPTRQQESEDLLGEAVEALLAEVGEVCDRFENPPPPEDEPTLCADGGMAAAPARATPDPETDAVARTESALDAVETSAAELLEQAADELVGQLTEPEDTPIADVQAPTADDPAAETEPPLEAEPESDADSGMEPEIDEPEPEAVEQIEDASAAEPESQPQPDAPAETDARVETEELLAAAADELMDLDFGGAPTRTIDPETEPGSNAEPEPEGITDAEPDGATPADALDADTLDAVLDGTFETPDGDVDTDAVGDDAGGFTLPEDKQPQPEPDADPQAVGAAINDAVPVERPVHAPEPGGEPPVRAPARGRAVESTPGSGWRRVLVWATPRARRATGALARRTAPLGAQGLILLSKPLASQPARIRDSVGWVALWTAFLGLCVWGWVLVRPSEQRAADPDASGIVSADEPATPGE